MVRNILVGVAVVVFSVVWAHAGAKEDVQAAAKKLGQSDNYSWTMTTEGGFGGKQEGKWQKDGLTMLSLQFGDNSTDLVFNGQKGAIKTQDGWISLAEATGDNAPQGPGRFIARMAQTFKTPAAQAEDMAGKVGELKMADGAYAGDLTEEAAKDLLTFRRRQGGNGPEIKNAKGNVKFWVKDGVLSKVQYHLEGTININGDDRDMNRTTTVEVKDIGSTKIEVPADAKAKMG